MIKHFISVEIVDHRLVSMPHVMRVTGKPAVRPVGSRAIEPLRGIAIAAALSIILWAILIAAFTGSSGDDATRGTATAACAGPTGTPCATPPNG